MPPYCLRARPMTECSNTLSPTRENPGVFAKGNAGACGGSRLRSAHRHGRGWAVVMFGFTPFMLAATTTEKRAMPLSNSKDPEGKGL